MSLSTWHQAKQSHLPQHHGEKSMATAPRSVSYKPMENLHDFMDIDQQAHLLLCVDPRTVNPRSQDREYKQAPPEGPPAPAQAASTVPQNWAMQPGGGFYAYKSPPLSHTVKLEMEEFGDLSSYLPGMAPKPTSSSSVDELNTPIFDKDAFDFPTMTPDKAIYSEITFPLKFEYDPYDNQQKSNTFKDNSFGRATDRTISDVGQNDISYVSNNGSPVSTIDDGAPIANDNFDDLSYTSLSPEGNATFGQYQPGMVTPEDSNGSMASDSKPRLILKMPANPVVGHSVVSTPDVIEEVVNFENATFNILDLVNEQDVTIFEAEILGTLAESNTTTTVLSSTSTFPSIPQKRPRKRRLFESEDEDYVPPSKKHTEDSDESDFEEERKKRQPRPRGRPPKRTESVSSDASKESSDVSKYRELRDKNNEASRKSRLKRKMKDMEYEKEAEELSQKNVRLKAQVEELEKMVNNFRTNLFKIMINK